MHLSLSVELAKHDFRAFQESLYVKENLLQNKEHLKFLRTLFLKRTPYILLLLSHFSTFILLHIFSLFTHICKDERIQNKKFKIWSIGGGESI